MQGMPRQYPDLDNVLSGGMFGWAAASNVDDMKMLDGQSILMVNRLFCVNSRVKLQSSCQQAAASDAVCCFDTAKHFVLTLECVGAWKTEFRGRQSVGAAIMPAHRPYIATSSSL
eukprot:357951-Chlamydomonas_euryale.AAC.12